MGSGAGQTRGGPCGLGAMGWVVGARKAKGSREAPLTSSALAGSGHPCGAVNDIEIIRRGLIINTLLVGPLVGPLVHS